MKEFNTPIAPKVIIWGGTGQAKVNRPIIEHYGSKVVAVFDDTPNLPSPFSDVEIYCGWDSFLVWLNRQRKREEIGFCIAIGNPHGRVRLEFQDKLIAEGLKPISVIHPTACIANDAIIGEGAQIMAGAIIQSEAIIGKQCIINSRAIIEHEVILDDAVEIQPGGVILGLSKVGLNSTIGTGVLVLSRVKIGIDVTIGAGTVVYRNVKNNDKIWQSTNRPI